MNKYEDNYEFYNYIYKNKPNLFHLILSKEEECKDIDDKFFAENYLQIFRSKYYDSLTASNFVKNLSKSVGANNISSEFCKELFTRNKGDSLYWLIKLGFDTSSVEAKYQILIDDHPYHALNFDISAEDLDQIIKLNKCDSSNSNSDRSEYLDLRQIFHSVKKRRMPFNKVKDIIISNSKHIERLLELSTLRVIEPLAIKHQTYSKEQEDYFNIRELRRFFELLCSYVPGKTQLTADDKYYSFLKEYAVRSKSIDLFLEFLQKRVILNDNIKEFDLKFEPADLLDIKNVIYEHNYSPDNSLNYYNRYNSSNYIFKEFCVQNSLYDAADVIMIYSMLVGEKSYKNRRIKFIFEYTNITEEELCKILGF